MPEDPRAVEAAAALQEGALRREVDLLRSRAQLLAAAGRVSPDHLSGPDIQGCLGNASTQPHCSTEASSSPSTE